MSTLRNSPVAPRPGERVETTPGPCPCECALHGTDGCDCACPAHSLERFLAENQPPTTAEAMREARIRAESPALYELAREVAKEACRTAPIIADPVKHVDCGDCNNCRARAIVARIEEKS